MKKIKNFMFKKLSSYYPFALGFHHFTINNQKNNYNIILLFNYVLYEFINRKKLRYPIIELDVTTNCNLKCNHCFNLMPYYKKNINLSFENLATDINLLMETIDYVFTLKIMGGEPFLNRNLGLFLEYMVNNKNFSKKFFQISIITNGTIIPDEKSIEIMEKYSEKINVTISNYGKKSEKIIEILEKHNISFELTDYEDEWYDPGNPISHNRSISQLKYIYDICYEKIYINSYFNKEFHICPRSLHGTKLGLIPIENKDFVILKDEDSIYIKRKKLFNLRKLNYIKACDYCDYPLKNVLKKRGEV